MTQEEKQILIKDICGRLQYRVKLGFENSDLILVPKEFNIYTMQLSTEQVYPKSDSMTIGHVYDVWNYHPYLRPMSSMTKEELKELNDKYGSIAYFFIQEHPYDYGLMVQHADAGSIIISEFSGVYDWLNAHHLDYRGLIPMGLALEAKEGMYKI